MGIKTNLKTENNKPVIKDVIYSIINRDKTYVTENQIIEFLSMCGVDNASME